MPRQRSPATRERKANPVRVAACEHLLDLIARLLARHWLRVQGKEVEGKLETKTRRGKAC